MGRTGDCMEGKALFEQLMTNLKRYHPSDDFSVVKKAYEIAIAAHGDQLRVSGEPYIAHPLSVAVILSELELDRETIAAGILHDVVEDTLYTHEDIVRMFGEDIAHLVDGVTKLEKLQYSSIEEQQAENYRKMFLAMSSDIRVILIKIADRLHNLRTMKVMPPESQKKKAQETMDIYAPLSHRLGISKIRYELEDLAFRYLNPEAYYDLKEKIQLKQSEREAFVGRIVADLQGKVKAAGIDGFVEGRPKHFFSIYKKMVSQDKTLDQIYDLFAVRAVVASLRDCYEILGIVHEMYKPIPGRFKDYIAMPKSNMYQSLHNTLIGPGGEPFEVQIRTYDMHRTAEYGIAAHWRYKEGGGPEDTSQMTDEDRAEAKLSWLRQILEWQREMSDNKEYLDALKFDLNVYKDHVYCFSPKGEVISLINGATSIDFAYAIHSAVGNKMVGAKVNNKIEPIEYALQTGDRVEILTSQNSKGPSRDWLKIVKTSQARNKIQQWFKRENKDENAARGKEMLEKGAKKKGLVLSELLTPDRVKSVLNRFSLTDWESICAAVGHGGIKEGQVINRLYEEYLRQEGKAVAEDEAVKRLVNLNEQTVPAQAKRSKGNSGITVKGVGDINVRFSKCCSPVPGDEIVGFVTRGRGVSVHRTDCVNIIHLDDLDRHRLIEAEWQIPEKSGDNALFRADICITCDEQMGLLVDISRIFNDEKIDVKSLNARTAKNEAVFNVTINIASKEQLEKVRQRLMATAGVNNVERVTS